MNSKMTPERIKETRKELGLSQEGLARELGISAATVNRWERGRNQPGQMAMQLLERLARKAARTQEA